MFDAISFTWIPGIILNDILASRNINPGRGPLPGRYVPENLASVSAAARLDPCVFVHELWNWPLGPDLLRM
jgi:hypothetical protein